MRMGRPRTSNRCPRGATEFVVALRSMTRPAAHRKRRWKYSESGLRPNRRASSATVHGPEDSRMSTISCRVGEASARIWDAAVMRPLLFGVTRTVLSHTFVSRVRDRGTMWTRLLKPAALVFLFPACAWPGPSHPRAWKSTETLLSTRSAVMPISSTCCTSDRPARRLSLPVRRLVQDAHVRHV